MDGAHRVKSPARPSMSCRQRDFCSTYHPEERDASEYGPCPQWATVAAVSAKMIPLQLSMLPRCRGLTSECRGPCKALMQLLGPRIATKKERDQHGYNERRPETYNSEARKRLKDNLGRKYSLYGFIHFRHPIARGESGDGFCVAGKFMFFRRIVWRGYDSH